MESNFDQNWILFFSYLFKFTIRAKVKKKKYFKIKTQQQMLAIKVSDQI